MSIYICKKIRLVRELNYGISFMRMVANSKSSSLQLRLVQIMSHSYFSQRLISSLSMETRKFCMADISGR